MKDYNTKQQGNYSGANRTFQHKKEKAEGREREKQTICHFDKYVKMNPFYDNNQRGVFNLIIEVIRY